MLLASRTVPSLIGAALVLLGLPVRRFMVGKAVAPEGLVGARNDR
jgi:hypothetical protein